MSVLVSADLSPVQVPLIQTPLGHNDSESDTDSSSGFSTPVATSGESTKQETTAEKRPSHSMFLSLLRSRYLTHHAMLLGSVARRHKYWL